MYSRKFLAQSPVQDVMQKYFPVLGAFDGH